VASAVKVVPIAVRARVSAVAGHAIGSAGAVGRDDLNRGNVGVHIVAGVESVVVGAVQFPGEWPGPRVDRAGPGPGALVGLALQGYCSGPREPLQLPLTRSFAVSARRCRGAYGRPICAIASAKIAGPATSPMSRATLRGLARWTVRQKAEDQRRPTRLQTYARFRDAYQVPSGIERVRTLLPLGGSKSDEYVNSAWLLFLGQWPEIARRTNYRRCTESRSVAPRRIIDRIARRCALLNQLKSLELDQAWGQRTRRGRGQVPARPGHRHRRPAPRRCQPLAKGRAGGRPPS
jgi:hypothetical protein